MKITGEWINTKATQDVCAMLGEAGYQALFVGGCVRNALLDAPVQDIDIATDALPDTVIELAQGAGFKAIPTGIEHGTVTVVADHIAHEVTTFRKDVETHGRRAVVAFSKDVTEDARRRDFTMNALYARPDGTVIDPLNGLPDLQARQFRFIEDAAQRIQEDYLRSLRFFRFNAWYGDPEAGLDPEALAAIASHLDGLSVLSKERVGSEMLKLLAAPDPCVAVAAMRQVGALAQVLPGADDRGLGPLVHWEAVAGLGPSALRRLAVLGGIDVAEHLRLSKVQAKHLELLAQMIADLTPAAEIGYRYGKDAGQDVILLRAAMLDAPLDHGALVDVDTGASATFPLKAADLQPALDGPQLGQTLKQAERLWIDSGFELSKQELLHKVAGS